MHSFLAPEPDQVQMVVTGNLIFTALGAVGFLRHLASTAYYPPVIWTIFAILTVWAIVWAVTWFLLRRKQRTG